MMKKMILMITVLVLGLVGCKVEKNDDDTSVDTSSSSDSDTETGTNSEAATDSDTGDDSAEADPNDDKGGPDEECFSQGSGDNMVVWCDNETLIAHECGEFASGCCCRTPCEPNMCAEVGEEKNVPCTALNETDTDGYCDYVADMEPITYACNTTCIPRSDCTNVDTDGSCLDTDTEENGLCLEVEGEDTDTSDTEVPIINYCQPTCGVKVCDDNHLCQPVYNASNEFENTGACIPKN